jgi:hypothetical protein
VNPYVVAGYCAAAAMLGSYGLYVRRRVRVLTRAAPPPPPDPPGGGADAAPGEGRT